VRSAFLVAKYAKTGSRHRWRSAHSRSSSSEYGGSRKPRTERRIVSRSLTRTAPVLASCARSRPQEMVEVERNLQLRFERAEDQLDHAFVAALISFTRTGRAGRRAIRRGSRTRKQSRSVARELRRERSRRRLLRPAPELFLSGQP